MNIGCFTFARGSQPMGGGVTRPTPWLRLRGAPAAPATSWPRRTRRPRARTAFGEAAQGNVYGGNTRRQSLGTLRSAVQRLGLFRFEPRSTESRTLSIPSRGPRLGRASVPERQDTCRAPSHRDRETDGALGPGPARHAHGSGCGTRPLGPGRSPSPSVPSAGHLCEFED